MRYFYYFRNVLLLLTVVTKSIVRPTDEITIIGKKTFMIYKLDDIKSVPVNVEAIYDKQTKKYIIKLNNDKDYTITLGDPLRYDIFLSEFTSKFNTISKADTGTLYTEYSLNQIFLWLSAFPSDNDKPLTGQLNLNRWIVVNHYTPGTQELSEVKRKKLIQDATKDFYKLQIKVDEAYNNILEQTDSVLKRDRTKRDRVKQYVTGDPAKFRELINIIPDKVLDTTALVTADSVKKILNYKQSTYNKAKDSLAEKKQELLKDSVFPIKKIAIQFERGFIERIQVCVENKYGTTDIYENYYAIGFTSIQNFSNLNTFRLFIRGRNRNEYIFLSDVIAQYDNILDLYTRDYSPADTAINNLDPSQNPSITLRKEQRIHLFDTKIFTDMNGIQENSPNGLVQVEGLRRFNIASIRNQIRGRINYGFFNSFTVFGAINKIEQKVKYLEVRNNNTVLNNVLVSPNYVTNLDLRRYENLSGGINLNCLLYDVPHWKFTLYWDVGARYGHVPLVDSARKITNGQVVKDTGTPRNISAHTMTLTPFRTYIEVFSERRVGFQLGYQYNYTFLYSNNFFKQVVSEAKSDLDYRPIERKSRKSHMVELILRAETSKDNNGNLFLRTRFFWQHGDVNTFFPQIQVGYSYNIIFKK